MRTNTSLRFSFLFVMSVLGLMLNSCSTYHSNSMSERYSSANTLGGPSFSGNYESRIPSQIATSEPTVVVDPQVHVWGAYNSSGNLVRAGIASAGADYCPDLGSRCHTHTGTHRVYSLGSPSCISHKFPMPRGGAPMPYCMYFSGGQALHGVPDNEVGEGNYSHGCVRLRVGDAEWLRYNFVNVGTKVVVKPY